jgi:hypothetical protein
MDALLIAGSSPAPWLFYERMRAGPRSWKNCFIHLFEGGGERD